MSLSGGDVSIPGVIEGTAVTSDDERYMYTLTRRWAPGGTPATFVMLHPTIADGSRDDPTVRRCMALAQKWGCTAAILANVYGYRVENRDLLWDQIDPVGPRNDVWLHRAIYCARMTDAPVVAAWGTHARVKRVQRVLELDPLAPWLCLGRNADGSPVHPTHADLTVTPTRWRPT